MNNIDFSTFQFRCSGLRNLMVKSRSKSDPLSETTKSYLREVWVEQVFGRKKVISSPAMEKGTAVESDSMELVQQVTGKTFFKNNKELHNDYIKGTPDIIDIKGNCIKDTKSNWDLWTYSAVTEDQARKDYYFQVLGYMWLAGVTNGELLYGLVNTPEHLMYKEWQKLAWNMDEAEAERITRLNHTFDDIPPEMRLKQFHFEYAQEDVDALVNQIELSREYLKGLHL